jgi:hypothetical protein
MGMALLGQACDRGEITDRAAELAQSQGQPQPGAPKPALPRSKGAAGSTWTGPASGEIGQPAVFNVTLSERSHLAGTVRVTPWDSIADGTFNPTSLDLSDTTRSGSFTYTPTHPGTRSIAIANNRELLDPPPVSFNSRARTNGSRTQTGSPYFVAPKSTSGRGTKDDPFGLPDLLTTATSPVAPGRALTILQPGDTLYFLGGEYHIRGSTNPGYYANQLIGPTVSGTASQPITLAAYPGQAVRMFLEAGSQPLFGTAAPTLNYVRFLGFTVQPTSTYTSGGILEVAKPFDISGSGCEVAYNEIIGQYAATQDNHEAIQVASANAAWIHHNSIHGFTGLSFNSDGIKVYYASNTIFEDNYITGCTAGVYDKGWTATPTFTYNGNTWRRNWIVDNSSYQFVGNNQTTDAQYYMYDNVFDGIQPMNLNVLQVGDQIYNNFLRNLSSAPGGQVLINNNVLMMADTIGGLGRVYQTQFWNNVMLQGGTAGIEAYHSYDNYVRRGSKAPFAYSDYNVYDGAPGWDFPKVTFNLSQFRRQGFETHSSVVKSDSMLYPNIASGDYTLAAAYQTAGRYGDPVGPRFPINQIMNPGRYGPRVKGTGSSPRITRQPENQTVALGGSAAFSVQVSGSGLLYQWQRSNDHGKTWITIQGANSQMYTISKVTAPDHAKVFRCLVAGVGGSLWSNPVTLSVNARAAPPITTKTSRRTGRASPEGSEAANPRSRGDLH